MGAFKNLRGASRPDFDHSASRRSLGHAEVLDLAAHELAQPLTVALGYALSLRNRGADLASEKLEYLSGIDRSLEQLSWLVENLSAFADIESDDVSITRSSIDLGRVLGEAIENQISGSDRTYELDCPDELRLRVDVMLFRQILYNLLGNAKKFSTSHSAIIVQALRANDFILITVRNQAPRFSAREAKEIFERSVQLNQSSAGLGLGLYVARSLVEAHGGRIWARSDEELEQVVFCIALPADAPDEEPSLSASL